MTTKVIFHIHEDDVPAFENDTAMKGTSGRFPGYKRYETADPLEALAAGQAMAELGITHLLDLTAA